MGYNILSVNIGITISPAIGGALYEHAGYYSTFILLFSLIALDIVMRLLMVERKTATEWEERDRPVAEGSSTQYGTIGSTQDTAPAVHGDMIQAVDDSAVSDSSDDDENDITGLVPETTESRENTVEKEWSLPPVVTLLCSPRVFADLYGCFVAVGLLVSFDSALPLFVQRTFNWGPTEGGLVFITITLPILGAPLAGKLTDKYRSRWIPAVGFILVGILTALLSLVHYGGVKQIVLFCSLLVLNGTMFLLSRILLASTDRLPGCARVVAAAPLGADLSRTVKEMEDDHPGIFGKAGAQAQVFALYTMASALGVLLGPIWTSFAYGGRHWMLLVMTLGCFCASAAIPLVSSSNFNVNGVRVLT